MIPDAIGDGIAEPTHPFSGFTYIFLRIIKPVRLWFLIFTPVYLFVHLRSS